MWTTEGLDLIASEDLATTRTSRIRRLLRILWWEEIDVLSIAAVMQQGLTPADLAGVLKARYPG